jgi:hypothetical protein
MNSKDSVDEARRINYEHVNTCPICKHGIKCPRGHVLECELDKAEKDLQEKEYWDYGIDSTR